MIMVKRCEVGWGEESTPVAGHERESCIIDTQLVQGEYIMDGDVEFSMIYGQCSLVCWGDKIAAHNDVPGSK